jgi:hypothetical protein
VPKAADCRLHRSLELVPLLHDPKLRKHITSICLAMLLSGVQRLRSDLTEVGMTLCHSSSASVLPLVCCVYDMLQSKASASVTQPSKGVQDTIWWWTQRLILVTWGRGNLWSPRSQILLTSQRWPHQQYHLGMPRHSLADHQAAAYMVQQPSAAA